MLSALVHSLRSRDSYGPGMLSVFVESSLTTAPYPQLLLPVPGTPGERYRKGVKTVGVGAPSNKRALRSQADLFRSEPSSYIVDER